MTPELATLKKLIGRRSVASVERDAGFAQGALSKRLSGATAIRADDLIAISKAVGVDPISALVEAVLLDAPRPSDFDLSEVPDAVIFAEAAQRASAHAVRIMHSEWRDSL